MIHTYMYTYIFINHNMPHFRTRDVECIEIHSSIFEHLFFIVNVTYIYHSLLNQTFIISTKFKQLYFQNHWE